MSIIGGIGRIGYMRGGKKALWRDEDLAETFLNRVIKFIDDTQEKEQPFFLYYALHQPHVPRVPSERFRGATELGPRGDVIVGMELPDDAAIDSQDQYAALVGRDPVGRKELLVEDVTCGKMLRSGNWTYLSPSEGSPYMKQVRIETGLSHDPQLYNMDYDIGQRENVAWEYRSVVTDMEARIRKIMESRKTR